MSKIRFIFAFAFFPFALAVAVFAAMPAVAEERTAGEETGFLDIRDDAMTLGSMDEDGFSILRHNISDEITVELADETGFSVAAADEEAAEKLGFPQMDTSTYASQVFWLLVSFGLMYVLMSKYALPRVGAVLDIRRDMRDDQLDRAADMQAEAESLKTSYEESLAAARDQAQDVMTDIAQKVTDKANAENSRFAEHARTRIAAAEQNIAKAREEALKSLADISADVAADIVQKLTDTPAHKTDAQKAVATVMKG